MAREEDDDVRLAPRSAPLQASGPADLGPFSIAELDAYVESLEREIGRVKEAVAAKKKHRGGADSLFKQ